MGRDKRLKVELLPGHQSRHKKRRSLKAMQKSLGYRLLLKLTQSKEVHILMVSIKAKGEELKLQYPSRM
jgi:hypothetical protein